MMDSLVKNSDVTRVIGKVAHGRMPPKVKPKPLRGAQGYSGMVKWTAYAKDQVCHIHNYIAQDSPLYARWASEELGLYSYRILYEIKSGKLIEVLAVIHKRQHLEAEEIPRA